MLKKFIATSLLLGTSSAFAGGLDLSEFSTAASVGSAGTSNQTHTRDASASALNLGAMTEVEGDQVTVGLSLMDFHSEFKDDGGSSPGGSDVGNAGDLFPVPFFGYVSHLDENWTFGLTMNSHYGLSIDYPNEWAGRFFAQEVTMQSINLTPSIAYRINDEWSVGAGLVIDYATLDMKFALAGGQVRIEDDDVALGGIFSVHYRPSEITSFGLTYRTEIKHEFEDNVDTRGGAIPGLLKDFSMDSYTPQQFLFGVRHELNEELALLGSANWQEWSRWGKAPTSVNGTDIGVDRELDDTWGAGVGVEYRLNPEWLLTCGYHYDSAMMDTSTRTADLPTTNIHRYGIGTEYKYSEKITLGFAFEHVDLGKQNLNQSNNLGRSASGEYDNYINFYTVNLNYKL